MSYCFNPDCQKPQNPDGNKFCQNCGSKLLLREHYRAIKPIGSGTFSRTFLAVDEDIPSKPICAIEQFFTPDSDIGEAEKAAERFRREAIQLDTLGKHPQIPQLLGYFQQETRVKVGTKPAMYLVQEFIEGQNLAVELEQQGPFNETQMRSLLEDLLPVLQFVHSQQVIHRDIKPQNIIRRQSDRRLVLVGFSASKAIAPTASHKSITIIGSPEYIAPEQLQGKAVFASDLYSLGMTCISLLTATQPFNLRDGDEWVWRQYLPQPVSAALDRILDKMLQISLQLRYKSAEKILKDLTQVKPQSWQCVQTLSGHLGRIRAVAISPDSQIVASGGEDNAIKLWNLNNSNSPRTLGNLLTQHSGWVQAIAFSPDGQILATGSCDQSIKIWNLGTGKLARTLGSFLGKDWGWVYAIAISNNGQILVSGHGDKTVKIWNLGTGKLMGTLSSHTAWVEAIALSPDGKLIASGSGDKTIKIWQLLTSGKMPTSPLSEIDAHAETVKSLAFSPDGKMLASGSSDNLLKLWQIGNSGQIKETPLHILKQEDWVQAIAISPDGQTVAAGSRDGTIKLWNPYTEELIATLQNAAAVNAVAFSGDSRAIAAGCADSSVRIWRVGHEERLEIGPTKPEIG